MLSVQTEGLAGRTLGTRPEGHARLFEASQEAAATQQRQPALSTKAQHRESSNIGMSAQKRPKTGFPDETKKKLMTPPGEPFGQRPPRAARLAQQEQQKSERPRFNLRLIPDYRPTPEQIIERTRKTQEYQRASANQRLQMLIRAAARDYGTDPVVPVVHVYNFSRTQAGRDDLKEFYAGPDTRASAAHHFLLSAVLTMDFGERAAEELGWAKEFYDASFLGWLSGGVPAWEDILANQIGREFARDIVRKRVDLRTVDLSRYLNKYRNQP